MKDLNTRFIQAHVGASPSPCPLSSALPSRFADLVLVVMTVSSLLNVAALGLVTVHGLWIGKYGV